VDGKLAAQDLIDVTVTAVESGPYGALVFSLSDGDPSPIPGGVQVGTPPAASERIALALLDGQSVLVGMKLEEGIERGQVSLADVQRGVAWCAQRERKTVAQWVEDHDVTGADAAFQFAAFGEVLFG